MSMVSQPAIHSRLVSEDGENRPMRACIGIPGNEFECFAHRKKSCESLKGIITGLAYVRTLDKSTHSFGSQAS